MSASVSNTTIFEFMFEKTHKDEEKPVSFHIENKNDTKIHINSKRDKQKNRTCKIFWWQ